MRVQSTLYNGHEIVKTHHAPSIVHDSEDTLEIVETTRKKMKDPMCVKKKIFWSDDILKEKAKARKERVNDPKQITAVTVITPTGLTEGERGFEQTKECYLTEVIPFFKTLKEHFEGIQKALIKEVKEMKEIFEELEAEVDQTVMDRKCDEIEKKNLLIANENLIADCLSPKFANKVSQPSQDTPEFDTVFKLNKMKASLQGKDNTIKKLKVKISQLMETRSEADRTLDFRALDFQITQLTEKVTVLQEQNDLFRAENAK
ncbi:hypothetical protein Tco_0733724 [Tanacetum coccineum]